MAKTDKDEIISSGAVRNDKPTARMKSHLNVGVITLMTVMCCAVIANLFKVSVLDHAEYESLANNYHFLLFELVNTVNTAFLNTVSALFFSEAGRIAC